MINKISQNKFLIFFFLVNILLGFFILSQIYSNKLYLFFLLIVSNGYLYNSFGKKIYTFHFFLSLFFWIGFWIKLVLLSFDIYLDLRVDSDYFVNKITDTKNYEVVNRSLLVSAMGILGFYCSLHVQKFFFPLNNKETYLNYNGNYVFIDNFIKKNVKKIIIIFLLLVLFCFTLNVFFQIYQKGIIPNSNINFFLNSFFKLLVIFGFTSYSSILIFHTFNNKNFSFIVVLASILENFISSVGMLSRGMFVNSLAIIFGLIKYLNLNDKKIFTKKFLVIIFIAVILFITSIKLSLALRTNIYFNNFQTIYAPITNKESNDGFLVNSIIQVKKISLEIFILLKNRFPGFEEVFYVSKKNDILNFDLLKKSFNERFDLTNLTFFEKIIKNSNFSDHQLENTNVYFINVPGILAFLYYSGSLTFVLISSFIIGLAISYIEKIVLNFFYNNLLLASVISQTLAYRFINFGYLPTNTYQLILSLFLNLLLIYTIYEFFKFKKNK
jgi:hypothetical protein